jgi:hypothetical protein
VYDFTFRKRDPLHTEKVLDNKKNLKKKSVSSFYWWFEDQIMPILSENPKYTIPLLEMEYSMECSENITCPIPSQPFSPAPCPADESCLCFS